MTRHLLTIGALDADLLRALIARGRHHAVGPDPDSRRLLAGHSVAQLFYEPSTRTRCSFELAARRLGADVLNLDIDTTSAVKGETVVDTARTLAAMGVKLFVIRHSDSDVIAETAAALPEGSAVLNAGAGSQQHPTQALLDMLTLDEAGFRFQQLDISIVGDIRRSRVANSAVEALSLLGAKRIRLGGPGGFLPDTLPDMVERHDSLATAIEGADVVMTLRIQRERMRNDENLDTADYHRQWGLSEDHLKEHAPKARVMHPGPMNRGVEIDSAVADGPRSLILDQVRNGVAARMAALEWLAKENKQ
jgi:aspartate carbamoyltransferase catalytic subunit